MNLRSIVCACGTTRPGSELRCPNCGRLGGREVLERGLPAGRGGRDRQPAATTPATCWLCGLRRVRLPRGGLVICPACDTVATVDD